MDQPVRHNLPLLDGLRGLAAVCIVVTHVAFQTGMVAHGIGGVVLARLDVGVALFFVLSGFLLTRAWARAAGTGAPAPDLRRYLTRRAARILPAYWVVLVAVLLTTASEASRAAATSNVALVQVYTGDLLPGFTQTWSLCTEVAFYLVLPAVAVWLTRSSQSHPRRTVVALTGACLVAWTWVALAADGTLPHRAAQWLPGHLDWFAAGMGLALLEARRILHPGGRIASVAAQLSANPWPLLGLAATTFWLASTPLGGPRGLDPATPGQAVLKEATYAIVATSVVLAVAVSRTDSGALAAVLGHRITQYVGLTSYGLFLWHQLILAAVFDGLGLALFSGNFWMVLVLTLLGSVGVAGMSWFLLERPILALAHRSARTAQNRERR